MVLASGEKVKELGLKPMTKLIAICLGRPAPGAHEPSHEVPRHAGGGRARGAGRPGRCGPAGARRGPAAGRGDNAGGLLAQP